MNDKKLEILEAAGKLFSQYGYKKTTLDDLADATGLKKSTLYHYYSGKKDLFRSMAEHVFINHTENMKRALDSDQDVIIAILSMLDEIEKNIKKYSSSLKALVGEYDEILKFVDDLFEEHAQTVIGLISSRIDRSVKEGQLDSSINSTLISEIILNFYSVVFKHCSFSDIYRNMSQKREEYLLVLFKPYLVNNN